ncbi:YHS domain-containing (seleno)protein [Rhabdaerophilum sp. SD176]|uniref:YHS domain-containing (seleno)protein n=1 Tax=Rhabdaerophilum sp. SD176 TaxID=2983548 RepID=UPI0024DF917B|nr:YHS domain-containing (seleno)protein [Rhabdaerophilum sp. SD176]
MQRRSLVILGLGLGAGALAATALSLRLAAETPGASRPAAIDTTLKPGIALGGYDPVAYFREGKPREGRADLVLNHAGVEWRFASETNRQAFTARPEAFMPAYGGYCSWAVAQGYTAKGDPLAWRIESGRLYLNYDLAVKAEWEKDVAGNISRANGHWPKITGKP